MAIRSVGNDGGAGAVGKEVDGCAYACYATGGMYECRQKGRTWAVSDGGVAVCYGAVVTVIGNGGPGDGDGSSHYVCCGGCTGWWG